MSGKSDSEPSARGRALLQPRRIAVLGAVVVLLAAISMIVTQSSIFRPRGNQVAPEDAESIVGRIQELQAKSASGDHEEAIVYGATEGQVSPTEAQNELIREVTNDVFDALPSKVVDLSSRMTVSDEDFTPASDAEINRLISQYNEAMMAVSDVSLEGTCTWSWPTLNIQHSTDHTITFERKGFSIQQACGDQSRRISGGVAFVSDNTDENYLDSFYLLMFAVFDPCKFQSLDETTITLAPREGEPAQTLQVTRAVSPMRTLFFDDQERLRRVDVRMGAEEPVAVSVELSEFAGDALSPIPQRVVVRMKDRSQFTGEDWPELMELSIGRLDSMED